MLMRYGSLHADVLDATAAVVLMIGFATPFMLTFASLPHNYLDISNLYPK